jgi:murein DD-endopeptidase MepM/ murein hydrolase activator NlpD
MAQKRKIKKQYAKAAREAKKTAANAKAAGGVIGRAARSVAQAAARHPAVLIAIAALGLIIMLVSGLFASCGSLGSGVGMFTAAASYLSEDADIDAAELLYTESEADLQLQINGAENDYPGFDEYRYSVGDISHNPYELMAYLTARHQDFTFAGVESELRSVFGEQYGLTFAESVETRCADPSDADGDGDFEPYEWNILTVTLTARSFTDVVSDRLSAEQRRHHGLLMLAKGNRQHVGSPFDFNWLPYVSSYYGWRVHPITGAKDCHKGVDIAVPEGTEIRAANAGTVSVGYDAGGYGNYVVIADADGLATKYAHCSETTVTNGQTVNAGDVIARVGGTGGSTGPHLHFEVIKDGSHLNPLYFAITNDDGSAHIPPGEPGGRPIPDDPGEPMTDAGFAALLAVAEAQIGKPYVWGAAGPDSYDCSGLICYVYREAGVRDFGRIGATAIYNACTPVSPEDARPGDVIAFHSTFSTSNPISHIGIYVGMINGRPAMLHAGSPVQYAYVDTAYRQAHFYGFARANP